MVAANLAVALAQRPKLRVGLLDVDVFGPSLPRLMGLGGKPPANAGRACSRSDSSPGLRVSLILEHHATVALQVLKPERILVGRDAGLDADRSAAWNQKLLY